MFGIVYSLCVYVDGVLVLNSSPLQLVSVSPYVRIGQVVLKEELCPNWSFENWCEIDDKEYRQIICSKEFGHTEETIEEPIICMQRIR